MTKPEIVSFIAERADISKKAATVVLDTIVDTIHSALKTKEGKIRISALGTFRVVTHECAQRSQPPHRQENDDSCHEGSQVFSRQGPQGECPRKKIVA